MGCPPRFATRRTERATLGARVGQVAEQLGTPLMPWQQYVADVAMELDPATGRLAYREVVLLTPRQSGKTSLILALAVHRALGMAGPGGPQRITYTAQNGVYARAKFLDEHVPLLERCPIGRRRPRPFRVRRTNGHEAILWANGSKHGIAASTETAGHGGTLDLAFLDEAFAHTDSRLEQGLRPTMITRPQPQFWVVSTAGTPDSVYLWGKVEAGRQRCLDGAADSIAYFEWSASEDDDITDPATWWRCMPALGITVSESSVQADFDSMRNGPEFARAYGNIWDPRRADPVIPLAAWEACADPLSSMVDPVALSFDVAPDRSWAAIAAAGRRPDGRMHVEIVEHRAGTGWLPGRLAQVRADHGPSIVVADPASPAGSLLVDVAKAGVEVRPVTAREHGQACGQFYDGVVTAQYRHLGQAPMVAALDGATKRPLGDAWAWSRKSSAVDICPLVAVTLAAWALDAAPAVDPMGAVW